MREPPARCGRLESNCLHLLYNMEVAIRPAVGGIKETVLLFAPRQSTNKMLSYKARNDDVLVRFMRRLIRVIYFLTRVS